MTHQAYKHTYENISCSETPFSKLKTSLIFPFSQDQLRLTGFLIKSLDPGCVLMVAGVTFVSAVAPRVGVQLVVTSFLGNFSFSDDIEALNRSLSKALEDFNQIDYNALLRGGRGFGTCNHPCRLHHICGPFGWESWDSPFLTFVGALIIWRFQARIFSFAVRRLTEGERFHVGHEAELRQANEEEEPLSPLVGEFA